MENPESRFVGDIEAAFKEVQEMKYRRAERKPESEQMSLLDQARADIGASASGDAKTLCHSDGQLPR